MTIFEAILLGLVQGLTEFIPVSSSGHLVLTEHFLHINPPATFDALVNLGTFLALLIYFRKRLWDIAVRLFRDRDYKLVRNLLISALPVLVVGYVFADFLQGPFLEQTWIVVVTLLVGGVFMVLLEKIPRLNNVSDESKLTAGRAGLVGLAQVLALIPGVSRSASTMIAGRLVGFNYAQAAEYSFLLSVPVMAAVLLKSFTDSQTIDFISQNTGAFIASTLAALAGGLFAVSFMLRFLAKGNFKIFGYYRIGLAAVIALLLLI